MMPYFNDDIVHNLTILTSLSTVVKRKTNKKVDSDDIIHKMTIWTSISTYTKYGQLNLGKSILIGYQRQRHQGKTISMLK